MCRYDVSTYYSLAFLQILKFRNKFGWKLNCVLMINNLVFSFCKMNSNLSFSFRYVICSAAICSIIYTDTDTDTQIIYRIDYRYDMNPK